jgi:hypothetical protein
MHNDEVETANYKVNDVQKLLEEQDYEFKHSAKAKHLSVLGSIGAETLEMLIRILCCCCCCRNCWSRSLKWLTDEKVCISIVFEPKIIKCPNFL